MSAAAPRHGGRPRLSRRRPRVRRRPRARRGSGRARRPSPPPASRRSAVVLRVAAHGAEAARCAEAGERGRRDQEQRRERRLAGRLTRSSRRAAAQPKASWRGVRWPIILSAVLIALYSDRPASRRAIQNAGATTPSEKFSARLSIAARATPASSRRLRGCGRRSAPPLPARRPGPLSSGRAATAATCSSRLRAAISEEATAASGRSRTATRHRIYQFRPPEAVTASRMNKRHQPARRRCVSVVAFEVEAPVGARRSAGRSGDRMADRGEQGRRIARQHLDRQGRGETVQASDASILSSAAKTAVPPPFRPFPRPRREEVER